MRRNVWFLFVLLVTLAMVAAQCVAAPAAEVPPAATEAPAEAPEAPVTEGAEITVSYMAAGTYDKAAEDLAAEFAERDIEVSIAAFPWATLRQNNTNDLITGAGQYDVMNGGYYLADVYQYFESLDAYFERDNYGEGMIPGILDPGKSEWYQGHHIGAPYGIDSYGVLYRTDLFEQAGIEPRFETWADFVEGAKMLGEALEGEDIAPFVWSYGAVEQLPAVFFGEYGGTFINAGGNYQLDADKAVAALKVMQEMLPYAPDNALALSIDEANAVFLDGKAAMLIGWPSFVRAAADDPNQSKVVGNWAQMEFPGQGFPWLSLWQMFIPASSEQKDAAWEWIREYTSEANAKRWFEEYGIGSVYVSTYEDPELLEMHGHDFPAALANFKRAKNPPLSGEAQDFLASTIGEVLTDQIEPEAAIEQVNAKWATITVPEALLEAAAASGLKAE